MKNMLQLAHVMLGKKKMLQLTHLICIIRSTRYLDDKPCHFFSNKSMSQDILANVP